MKTARFSQVVAQCGAPEVYTLWLPPDKDSEFQRALKTNRVMTVHRGTGGVKDYGEVGYAGTRESTLLVFPKSLAGFEETHIVGVKYELLEPDLAPAPSAPAQKPAAKQSAKKESAAAREAAQRAREEADAGDLAKKEAAARDAQAASERAERERAKAAEKEERERAKAADKEERERACEEACLAKEREREQKAAEREAARQAAEQAKAEAAAARARAQQEQAAERERQATAKREQEAERERAAAAARERPKAEPPVFRVVQKGEVVHAEHDEDSAAELAKLRRAVAKALKQLQAGKAVAAFQTLEEALDG